MKIYILDFDNDDLLEVEFDCVSNLAQFERDLDDTYPNGWYYDKEDAEEELK